MIGHHLRRWGIRRNNPRKTRLTTCDNITRARHPGSTEVPQPQPHERGGQSTHPSPSTRGEIRQLENTADEQVASHDDAAQFPIVGSQCVAEELQAAGQGQPDDPSHVPPSTVILVHPPVSENDHDEHKCLSGVTRWFQGFGESDPRGLTLHSTSKLDLAMLSFAQYIHLAIAKGDSGAWKMLREMPLTLENAFEIIFPDTFSTVVIHLLALRNAEAVFIPVVDTCLDRLARTSSDKLGVNHPLVALFSMAASHRLTLRICARLWTVTRRNPALTDEENDTKWAVRQDHGFGMVLYQFGQRHQADEHLRRALENAQSINSLIDKAYILTDMELTATGKWDYRSMQGYIERDERRILYVAEQLGIWCSAVYLSKTGEYERRKLMLDRVWNAIRLFYRKHQLNMVRDENHAAYPFNSSFLRKMFVQEAL